MYEEINRFLSVTRVYQEENFDTLLGGTHEWREDALDLQDQKTGAMKSAFLHDLLMKSAIEDGTLPAPSMYQTFPSSSLAKRKRCRCDFYLFYATNSIRPRCSRKSKEAMWKVESGAQIQIFGAIVSGERKACFSTLFSDEDGLPIARAS